MTLHCLDDALYPLLGQGFFQNPMPHESQDAQGRTALFLNAHMASMQAHSTQDCLDALKSVHLRVVDLIAERHVAQRRAGLLCDRGRRRVIGHRADECLDTTAHCNQNNSVHKLYRGRTHRHGTAMRP